MGTTEDKAKPVRGVRRPRWGTLNRGWKAAASEVLLKCRREAGGWQEGSKWPLVRARSQGPGLLTAGPATDHDRELRQGRARSARKNTRGCRVQVLASTHHRSTHRAKGAPARLVTGSPYTQGPYLTRSSCRPNEKTRRDHPQLCGCWPVLMAQPFPPHLYPSPPPTGAGVSPRARRWSDTRECHGEQAIAPAT